MATFGGAIKPSSSSFYNLEGEHVAKYVWAAGYLTKEMALLDIGCGYGYGTDFLATATKTAVGVDTDRRAISFARRHYKRDNLRFVLIRDLSELSSASFDAVIALEVIEHVADAGVFLSHVRRLLRPSGEFIMSTPNRMFTEKFYRRGKPLNPYHLHEFYPQEIRALLTPLFNEVEGYAQVSPGAYDALIKAVSESKIPVVLRRFIPRQLKVAYLRWKGVPDSRGKWLDYSIVPRQFIDDTFPAQVYRCTRHDGADPVAREPLHGTCETARRVNHNRVSGPGSSII
jgi:SAM-dependent methyltransferase